MNAAEKSRLLELDAIIYNTMGNNSPEAAAVWTKAQKERSELKEKLRKADGGFNVRELYSNRSIHH